MHPRPARRGFGRETYRARGATAGGDAELPDFIGTVRGSRRIQFSGPLQRGQSLPADCLLQRMAVLSVVRQIGETKNRLPEEGRRS